MKLSEFIAAPPLDDEGVIGELREALDFICAPLGIEPDSAFRAKVYWRDIAIAYRQRAKAALPRLLDLASRPDEGGGKAQAERVLKEAWRALRMFTDACDIARDPSAPIRPEALEAAYGVALAAIARIDQALEKRP